MPTVGVMLPLPFDKPFDYTADFAVQVGQLVEVPFGKEKQVGVVWTLEATSGLDTGKIKPIIKCFDFPPLTAQMMEFIKWVARYNMAPLGSVLKMVISVRSVFEPSPMTGLYTLSGKTLAEAKLKNSDARWHVMDLLKHAPYTRQEIASGAGVSQGVIKPMIDAGVLVPIYVENKKEFTERLYEGGTDRRANGRRRIVMQQSRGGIFGNTAGRGYRFGQNRGIF